MGQVVVSRRTDPAGNLALEEALLAVPRTDTWLYLWRNGPVVVIGRNQNPYLECSLDYLEEQGIPVVRRLSGGGAVYHDLGNLNYTFLCPESQMDVRRQTGLIQRAVQDLGVSCTFSGRNDLLCAGRKISGQAYYTGNGGAYHHGTLLVDVDLERMARALTPSGLKLETKSVPSVRRRVVNLRELNPEITVEAVAKALARRFQEEYGPAAVQEWDFEASPPPNLARYRSAQWNLGSCPAYGASMDVSTSAGIFQVRAKVVHGRITEAALSTDALEQVPVPLLEQALLDCPFLASEVAGRLEEALRPGGIPKEQE